MQSITVHDLHAGRERPLIDVREEHEFAAGHVPGAVNIPLDELGDCIADVRITGTVAAICQSGGRSARAAEPLAARGHDVTNVEGGTGEWVAAGYAVES